MPVGLLSSHIIFNYLLNELDTIGNKNSIKYNRYVDDILVSLDGILDLDDAIEKCFNGVIKKVSDGFVYIFSFGELYINKDKTKVFKNRKSPKLRKDFLEEFFPSIIYEDDELKNLPKSFITNKIINSIDNDIVELNENIREIDLANIYDRYFYLINECSDEKKEWLDLRMNEVIDKCDVEVKELYNQSFNSFSKITQQDIMNYLKLVLDGNENTYHDALIPINISLAEIEVFLSTRYEKNDYKKIVNESLRLYKYVNGYDCICENKVKYNSNTLFIKGNNKKIQILKLH